MTIIHSRRDFMRLSSVLALGPTLLHMTSPAKAGSLTGIGPLGDPDANGIRLPSGFSSRVIAISDSNVPGTSYRWHKSPDGGATFPTASGGWVYVSNSEESFLTGAGVSLVEFNASGGIVNARRILSGTNGNCAGGPTPWNTWLSCEEVDRGAVWECYPLSTASAVKRTALGYFKHEAAAVDPVFGHVYLTEDEGDGCFYRFVPSGGLPNLGSGTLQVAKVASNGAVTWANVPNPRPGLFGTRTRNQVSGAARFNGGEGCWYQDGFVYFTTKGDNRVWELDTTNQLLSIIYDRATNSNPILSGVDNVTVSSSGDVLVAEDGGDMQICVLDESGVPFPLLQVTGQSGSEITGPAFSPDGSRLYFSSQRGASSSSRRGITYEVTGPF
jgi:secreted PhoX family phosphatase